MTEVFIGLGSNIGNRRENIKKAIAALRALPGTEVKAVSSLRLTEAVGGPRQREFLNAAAVLETKFRPEQLLREARRIERELGRSNATRWGPRKIDIDILLYGEKVIRKRNLEIPHPLLDRRIFVLEALEEVAPRAVHPVLNKNIRRLLQEARKAKKRKDFRLIAVGGPIGVGKSTVASSLARHLGGHFVAEPIEEVKGLGRFYERGGINALSVQLSFLRARSRQLRNLSQMVKRDQVVVMDYFFEMEKIFSRLNLSRGDLEIYRRAHREASKGLPRPDIIIYLKARPETLLGRIRRRGRGIERKIRPEYLERVCLAYDNFFKRYRGSPVIIKDTEGISLGAASRHLKEIAGEIRRRLRPG